MRLPDENVINAIKAAVGPNGVVAEADEAAYLSEWRDHWRGRAAIVVTPASAKEVAAIVKICALHQTPLTPQGGNTGLVGGQIPIQGEVLLSLKRMRSIRDVSALGNTMTVDAGVTLHEAQTAADDVDRLFPLSIGSEGACQIGGAISTNAGGVNVLRYGNMRDLVLGLEVVLPNGEIWNGLKRLRKDNTGYDLKQLFIGGEGTLGVVTGAVLKLFPRPREKLTVFAGLSSPRNALTLLSRAHAACGGVTSFELMSNRLIDLLTKNIPGVRNPLRGDHPWYALIEFSAATEGALRKPVELLLTEAMEAGEISDAAIAESDAQTQALWRMRHAASAAMKPEGGQAKFDVSTPVASVPDFLDDAERLVSAACPNARIIAFGHLGDGNIHYDILQPEDMDAAAFDAARGKIKTAVYEAIDRHDGSISAEHGIGLAKRDDIACRKQPAELAMMRAIKAAIDPAGIMNPGKML